MRDHTRGMLLMLAGVLVVSTNALLIRLARMSAPALTTLLWRQVTITLVQFVLCCVFYRGVCAVLVSGRQAGVYFWAAAPLYAAGSTGVILSFTMTSAANALVLFTLQPLWATLGSLFYFQDPLPARKALAVLVGLGCALLVFAGTRLDNRGSATGQQASAVGDLLALAGGMCFAGYFMVCRACALAGAGNHLLPTAIGGQLCAALFALVLVVAHHTPGTPSRNEFWVWIGLDGVVGTSLLLTTCAMRHIIPPENAIVGLLEMVLGPMWVFIALGEVPLVWTVVAGIVLLVTITLHEYFELKEYRRNKRHNPASPPSDASGLDSTVVAPSVMTSSSPLHVSVV